MQRLTHNSKVPTARRRPSAALVYLLVLTLATPLPLPGKPATVGQVTSLPSFQALMLVIANLNRAMRSAAENPQDDWRRADAQRAYAALPAAIMGLAGSFKQGKLGNEDLPMVQSMLGGFVDKNAADNFKKFMKSPNASLIPQVSPQLAAMLPKVSGPGGGGAPAAPAPGHGPLASGNAQPADAPAAPNPQILSLADPSVMASPGKDKSQAISYDEGAAKQKVGSADTAGSAPAASAAGGGLAAAAPSGDGGPVANNAASSDSRQSEGSSATNGVSGGGSSVAPAPARFSSSDAISDLRQLEVKMVTAGPAVKEDPDKADFFKSQSRNQQENEDDTEEAIVGKRHVKKKKARHPASLPQGALSPKYFNVRPLVLFAESLLIEEAHAEDDGGDGGQKDGSKAAEILYGIAAIIAAGAPIAVAGIQASADKYIAKTNADAQIQMTQITSDTSKYLADQQKDIAEKQADIAQQVNKSNNDYVSQRLQMQLTELSNARHEAEAAEQQKLAIEQQYNNQRIALAQQQADQNVKLAQQTLNAQLTQLGLSSGAVNSPTIGNRLTSSASFGAPSSAGSVSLGAPSGGGTPQTQGAVVSDRSAAASAAEAGRNSRGKAANTPDAMSFRDGGTTVYDLGNGNQTLRGADVAGVGGVPGTEGPIAANGSVAPQSNGLAGLFANRGTQGGGGAFGASGASAAGSGSSALSDVSLAGAMTDLRSFSASGDTAGIGSPASSSEVVQGELNGKGNEALLASVHQLGGQRALHPRGAALGGSVFDSVTTVAAARGNRGGLHGKRGTRSRLAATKRGLVTSGVDESRLLAYLRPKPSGSPVNGSTPEFRLRILTPQGRGSDLGLFTRAVTEAQPENFVQWRAALETSRNATTGGTPRAAASRERGGTRPSGYRAPASTDGDGSSGHKRVDGE